MEREKFKKGPSNSEEGSSFFQKCRNQAFTYLSLREHNRRELATKLKVKGYDEQTIDDVLDSLVEDGSLSEERYARSFIRSNNRRHPEGRTLVLQRLAAKGADRETSRQIVAEIYTREYTSELVAQARAQILKKGKTKSEDDVRQALIKLGFSNNDIKSDD